MGPISLTQAKRGAEDWSAVSGEDGEDGGRTGEDGGGQMVDKVRDQLHGTQRSGTGDWHRDRTRSTPSPHQPAPTSHLITPCPPPPSAAADCRRVIGITLNTRTDP